MDKLILVYYVNVGDMTASDWMVQRNMIKQEFAKEKDMIGYVIPVRSESRMECLNPKLVSEEEYEKAAAMLVRNQKIVDGLTGYKDVKKK